MKFKSSDVWTDQENVMAPESPGGFPRGGDRYWQRVGMVEPAWSFVTGRRLVAVDPGDEHVGVAAFGEDENGWECLWSAEMTPQEFESWLGEQMVLARIDYLVVEEWRLFPEMAGIYVGSDMPTSQLIGAIRYIWRATKNASNRWPAQGEVEFAFQTPKIKKPMREMLRRRGIFSVAKFLKVGLDHASDAELHGFTYIIKTLKEPVHQNFMTNLKKAIK